MLRIWLGLVVSLTSSDLLTCLPGQTADLLCHRGSFMVITDCVWSWFLSLDLLFFSCLGSWDWVLSQWGHCPACVVVTLSSQLTFPCGGGCPYCFLMLFSLLIQKQGSLFPFSDRKTESMKLRALMDAGCCWWWYVHFSVPVAVTTSMCLCYRCADHSAQGILWQSYEWSGEVRALMSHPAWVYHSEISKEALRSCHVFFPLHFHALPADRGQCAPVFEKLTLALLQYVHILPPASGGGMMITATAHL